VTPTKYGSVFIAQDSISVRQTTSFAVKDAGYEVMEAAGGKASLRKFNNAGSDIITVDDDMKEMDGIEFIRPVQNTARHRFTPFVMLMTDSQGSKRQKAKQAGASCWIIKPSRPDQLGDMVKRFLR
jgi:two-component system, chemotaxis family, chemotaxis protein CheY